MNILFNETGPVPEFRRPGLRTVGLASAVVIATTLSSLGQSVYINGEVKGNPNNNQLENVKVVAVKTENNARVDSTYTDINGHYDLNFILDEIYEQLNQENKVFPNPYQTQTNLQVNILKEDNYTLTIINTNGQITFKDQITLNQGQNTITLNGGETGIHIITLTNGKENYSFKTIQTNSTGTPIAHSITNTNFSPQLKSTLDDIITIGDEIRLEFTRENTTYEMYEPTDTTFTAQTNQTINKTMQQIPYIFTTTLKTFLENGEPVTTIAPGFTTTIEFPTGTKNYAPDENNEINIQEPLYPVGNTLGNVTMYHDTTTYTINGIEKHLQNWIIIRFDDQETNRDNPVQTYSTNLIPEYTTTASLDSLDNRILNYYAIQNKAETQPGTYVNLDGGFSIDLILSSGGVLGASTFIDLSKFGIDSLDIVRFGFNLTTGIPNTAEEQARLDEILQLAVETRYLPNGDTLLPPHRIYTIASFSDPRWQEIISREYENLIYTTYYNGTPENSRWWSSTYTYNGHLRLKNTTAKYSIFDSDSQIFGENFSAVTGEEEGSGGLAPYIWDGTNEQPTKYAYSISAIPALLNLGTGQTVKGTAPKELHSITKEANKEVIYEESSSSFSGDFEVNYNYIEK